MHGSTQIHASLYLSWYRSIPVPVLNHTHFSSCPGTKPYPFQFQSIPVLVPNHTHFSSIYQTISISILFHTCPGTEPYPFQFQSTPVLVPNHTHFSSNPYLSQYQTIPISVPIHTCPSAIPVSVPVHTCPGTKLYPLQFQSIPVPVPDHTRPSTIPVLPDFKYMYLVKHDNKAFFLFKPTEKPLFEVPIIFALALHTTGVATRSRPTPPSSSFTGKLLITRSLTTPSRGSSCCLTTIKGRCSLW